MGRAERLGHGAPSTVRVVAEIAVASVVTGVVMGVLWWLLTPDITGVVVEGPAGGQLGVHSQDAQRLFDRDAIFALLGAGAGLVLAVAFAVRHRKSPVAALVALVVAGIGGSLLAQLTGLVLGPSGSVDGLADGAETPVPLHMESQAALIVWSMVATVVAAIFAAFRQDPH